MAQFRCVQRTFPVLTDPCAISLLRKQIKAFLVYIAEIARFPQEAVRADRRTIIETRGMSVRDAMKLEWSNGLEAIRREGTAGAGRFRDCAGRHGDFDKI